MKSGLDAMPLFLLDDLLIRLFSLRTQIEYMDVSETNGFEVDLDSEAVLSCVVTTSGSDDQVKKHNTCFTSATIFLQRGKVSQSIWVGLHTYRISLGHQVNQQIQKSKNLNDVPFLCTKLLQKRGHYSRGDIIQGRTLIKEIRYI